jgi:hypothetical protein
VVSEVDHHAQADEEQKDRPTDGEPRVVLCSRAGLKADGKQAGRAVDEGGNECTQHHLGPTIA